MKDLTLQKILKEFLGLSNTLEQLLFPTLLEAVNEVDVTPDKFFEEDFEDFKLRFKNLSKLTATFIRELKKVNIQNHTGLKDKGFIQKLDSEIKDTFDFYENQMRRGTNKNKDYITKVQNAFLAYIQLAKVVNGTILEYNEVCKDVLPVLQNIPEPSRLNISIDLENYFLNWIKDLNSLLNDDYIKNR